MQGRIKWQRKAGRKRMNVGQDGRVVTTRTNVQRLPWRQQQAQPMQQQSDRLVGASFPLFSPFDVTTLIKDTKDTLYFTKATTRRKRSYRVDRCAACRASLAVVQPTVCRPSSFFGGYERSCSLD
mmetsp:Transcript_662/g.2059  ORF Transcript_662/g.2059 Transcript_662/m.2059 type:complete len:125 (+) Transcript_662:1105-1479(+)